ncbi:MAG: acylphosphatase, partial [Pseudomonadota bacterium]
GEENNVKALIDWTHTGPPYARVENVEVKWEPYTGEFSGFSVVH